MNLVRILASAIVAFALLLVSCSQHHRERGSTSMTRNRPTVPLVETIAHVGHGRFFDAEMREIPLTPFVVEAMQHSILEATADVDLGPPPEKIAFAIEDAQSLLQAEDRTMEEKLVLQGGILERQLEAGPENVSKRFLWRNGTLLSYILRHFVIREELRPEVLRAFIGLGFLEDGAEEEDSTGYIDDCRAHEVPIPPDWAESGTAWVRQGSLSRNLLDPGGQAVVWTYTDPNRRGGCVALPRGDGSRGSPAGIICQSATTGHACFWDNVRRGVEPEQFLGWEALRLEISTLKDGSNLNTACPSCHRGNNVFLISPDDATWAKLLRGPLSGPRLGTFTTRVESSTDRRGGHPRYIPISTLPPRPGWENAWMANTCAGACHETASTPSQPPMPPTCAQPSFTDPGNCYGTP